MKHLKTLVSICAAAVTIAAPAFATDGVAVEITNVQPFTHTAEIPARADLSSLKFEGVKAVRVATKRTSRTAQRYCVEGSPEPGGSMSCPEVRDGFAVPAYRITYSYSGPALASDEYANTHYTFSVNLRPEELNAGMRQAVSARRVSRSAAAEAFKITTSRGLVRQVAIDEANSEFCQGTYTDGSWIQTDPNCEDKVTYKTVVVPSEYITVQVDPASTLATVGRRSPAPLISKR